MAIKAPTFVQEAETAWNTTTSPKSAGPATVQAGDVLVQVGGSEGQLTSIIPSGGPEWTSRQVVTGAGNRSFAGAYTATVAKGESLTVTLTRSGTTTLHWGGNVLTFRKSEGIGATAKGEGDGEPSLVLTTTQDNSAIVVIVTDWNAKSGTRAWRTVNGSTPTAENGLERTYSQDGTHYTAYAAYYPDVGAKGEKTVGLTLPAGQRYSIVAVEVKGAKEAGEIKIVEVNDSIHLSDARTQGVMHAQSDHVGLSESVKRSTAKRVTESVVLSSRPGQLAGRFQKDALALSVSQAQRASRSFADRVTLAENPGKRAGHSQADHLPLSDSNARIALARFKDVIGLAESLGRGIFHRFTDAISLSDSSGRNLSVQRADSLALNEVPIRTVGQRVADVIALAESLVRRAGRLVSDSLSLSDSSTEAPTGGKEVRDLEVSDSLQLRDHVDKAVTHSEADGIVLSEAVGRGVDRLIADALTLSESMTRRVDRRVADALHLAESWTRRAAQAVADALRLSDLLGLESGGRRALTLHVAIRPKLTTEVRTRPQDIAAVSVRPKLKADLDIRAKDKAGVKVRAKTKTNLNIRE